MPRPPRVLHVVYPWSPPLACTLLPPAVHPDRCDTAILACAEAMRVLEDFEQSAIVLGGVEAGERARHLGLGPFERLAPPLGKVALAARLFQKYADARGPFDVVHLWGESLAGVEPWRSSPRCVSMADLSAGEVRLLPGFSRRTAEQSWALPLPSMTSNRQAGRTLRREAIRSRLGVAPSEVTIALLCDPPDLGQVARFTFLLALMKTAGMPLTGILHSHGREESRGLARDWEHLTGGRVIVIDGPIANLLEGCDLATMGVGTRFSLKPEAPTWRERALARTALERGVPVVTATPELVPEPLRPAMLARSTHPAAFARTITELWESGLTRDGFAAGLAGEVQAGVPGTIADTLRHAWRTALELPGDADVWMTQASLAGQVG